MCVCMRCGAVRCGAVRVCVNMVTSDKFSNAIISCITSAFSPFENSVFHCKDVTIVNCFYHECVVLMNVIVVCVGYMIEVVR